MDFRSRDDASPALPPNPLELDQHAVILHHVDPSARDLFGGFVVPDAELKPDGLRMFREDVVKVFRNVRWTPEDIDDVDITGDVHKRSIDRLAEYFL
jgi:hypothetical protein